MKRILIFFFAFAFILLISSCATTSPNQARLVGTWKADKVEKQAMTKAKSPATDRQEIASPVAAESYSSSGDSRQALREKGTEGKVITSELSSTMTLNANKTAILGSLGKADTGTWKLDNKGVRLSTNNKRTGKTSTFDIVRVNDTSAVVTKTLPSYTLKITYKKVKK